MKAIETHYKGYRFRSRLEARWAVFFEGLGLSYEYEPEGFDLDGQYYLPDFKVKSPQGFVTWYEIKPESGFDNSKMQLFEQHYRKQLQSEDDDFGIRDTTNFATLVSDPYSVIFEKKTRWVCPLCGTLEVTTPYVNCTEGEWLCEVCDITTPSQSMEKGLFCDVQSYKGILITTKQDTQIFWNKVKNFAIKARQARFEHGETPDSTYSEFNYGQTSYPKPKKKETVYLWQRLKPKTNIYGNC